MVKSKGLCKGKRVRTRAKPTKYGNIDVSVQNELGKPAFSVLWDDGSKSVMTSQQLAEVIEDESSTSEDEERSANADEANGGTEHARRRVTHAHLPGLQ